MSLRLTILVAALLAGLASPALAQECASTVQEALADGRLGVDSVSAEGVRIVVRPDVWATASNEGRRALLDNVECALAGQGARLKRLELVAADKRVLARKSNGQAELIDKAAP